MIGIAGSMVGRRQRRNSAVKWLTPLKPAVSAGDGSELVRYLDDPTTPCYTTGWVKADKNRYHHERAPGSAKKYVFNPASWVYAYRDSLTAVSVANEWPYPGNSVPNDGWGSKRGVTAITPRHVICSHGGLGVGTQSYPTRFRFVGTDGESYDRTAIGCRYFGGTSPVMLNGAMRYNGDVNILTLNADLPATVRPVRHIPDHYKFSIRYAQWEGLFVCQSVELDSLIPSQIGEQAATYPWSNVEYTPPNFPRRHRSMCVMATSDPVVGYAPWRGDSGMPLFYGVGGELLLAGFVMGGGAGANFYVKNSAAFGYTWEQLINELIRLSDIHAGIAPTGYTISVANDVVDLLPP